jgi:hypothetical protein
MQCIESTTMLRLLSVALLVSVISIIIGLFNAPWDRSFPVHSANNSAVIVTGTSTGIGKQLAISLSEEGYHVYATVSILHQSFAKFNSKFRFGLLLTQNALRVSVA